MKAAGKDKSLAIISLVAALFFWVPLLNLVASIAALYFGIRALLSIRRDPAHYGGAIMAVIGIILGSIPVVLFVIGILEYLLLGIPLPGAK